MQIQYYNDLRVLEGKKLWLWFKATLIVIIYDKIYALC